MSVQETKNYVRPIILNGKNYSNWKIMMQAILESRDLWRFTISKPTVEDEDNADLRVKNAEIKALMYSSMDSATMTSAGACETGFALWKKIQENCQGTEKALKCNALSELLSIKYKPGENIVEYSGRFETTLGRVLATGRHVEEDLKVYAYKKTLPKEVKKDINRWTTSNPLGKLSELISHLKMEFHEEKFDEEDPAAVAFYGKETTSRSVPKPNIRTSNDKARTRQKDFEIICNYCKNKGHKWRECRKYKSDNNRKKKFATAKTGKQDLEKFAALMAHEESSGLELGQYTWVVDSGASRHMTYNKDLLVNFVYHSEGRRVLMGDGKPLSVLGQGSYPFKKGNANGMLEVVLWIPSLKQNLFSVRSAIEQGCDVVFDKDKISVYNKNIGEIRGRQQGSLFLLELRYYVPKDEKELLTNFALYSASLEEWHKRFAHCGIAAIKELEGSNAVKNLKITDKLKFQCRDCILGKQCRASHRTRLNAKAFGSSAILHIDTVGPIKERSLGGSLYFVLGTEEVSGYKMISFAKDKGDITNIVKCMINRVPLESPRTVKMIVTDNGTEYVNKGLADWLKDKGISHEMSAPYTPEQNGLAERSNRTVIEGVRTLLSCAKLPAYLWPEAAQTVVYATNRMLAPKDRTKTKYELYTGQIPDVSKLREFGKQAVVFTPKAKRKSKWECKGRVMRFIGYTSRSNTYRFFDEDENKVVISCDVTFLDSFHKPTTSEEDLEEDRPYMGLSSASYKGKGKQVSFNETVEEIISPGDYNQEQQLANENQMDLSQIAADKTFDDSTSSRRQDVSIDTNISEDTAEILSNLDSARRSLGADVDCARSPSTNEYNTDSSSQLSINDQIHQELSQRFGEVNAERPARAVTRSANGIFCPIYHDGMVNLNDVDISSLHNDEEQNTALFTLDDEPRTIEDARKSCDWSKWQVAMMEELEALKANDTWEVVRRPAGIKPIKNKWVFKVKLNPDGSIERHKARLVAKGYSQVPNVDYKETYAPVAGMNTVRILFAAANQLNMNILQFDVKTAFLHGDLDELIYMEHPEGFEGKSDTVCKLNKSLYGLKQAPRQWNRKFDNFLKEFDLEQSSIDKCLYYDREKTMLLVIYVDDGVVATKDKEKSKRLVSYLSENLELKVMKCESFLGFQVVKDKSKCMLTLKQSHYVDKVLERFGMADCKPISTPEEVGAINIKDSPRLGPEYPFKEAIGSLLYLVTCTRPDLAHAVSIASRTSEPTIAHWKMVKRILRYLKETRDLGICFKWEENPELIGFCDADYANDVETRRSTSGYCIMFAGAPIAWRCQRQAIVSLSTTEAEYISGCELVKELLPLREIMLEIGIINDTRTKIMIDNQSTVNIAKDEGGQQRTKHIDVREKWLSEQHAKGKIEVNFIPRTRQLADILTKPLHKTKFALNRSLLMTMLLAMLAMVTNIVSSYTFSRINPVYYKPTTVPYFGEEREYDISIRAINPCKDYFSNITRDDRINSKLISECIEIHRKHTSKVMKNCSVRSNEITGRHKRFVPAVALLYVVIASGTVYSVARSEINAGDIEKTMNMANENRLLVEKGHKFLNTTRHTIQAMNDRLAKLEKKVDYLNETMEAFPKILALRHKHNEHSSKMGASLVKVDNSVRRSEISDEVNNLIGYDKVRLWEGNVEQWSKLYSCIHETEDEDFIIRLKFKVPIKSNDINILKAEEYRFWNYTDPEYCWMKYSGPKYVMLNTTNDCYQDVQSFWMDEESLSNHPCLTSNKELTEFNTLFSSTTCVKEFKPSEGDVQVKRNGGMTHIYCWGHKITIKDNELACPDFVFQLPASEGFGLNGVYTNASKHTMHYSDSKFVAANENLAEQLKLKELKIYGTNLTDLSNDFFSLDTVMSSIGFGRNITITNVTLPDLVAKPIKAAYSAVSNILKTIQEALTVLAGLVIIVLLILSAPVIEVLITVLKKIIAPIKRTIDRVLTVRFRKPTKKELKRYWDDSFVV